MLKDLYSEARSHMQKALDALEHHLSTLRTGRANPAILNNIRVEYYGTPTPLNQVGTVSSPDARTLVVQSWDASALKDIEKAIRDSDLGLNPTNKGDALYISIPPLTEERRKELVKTVRHYAEEAKIAVRNARREALDQAKKLEKDKAVSEDDLKKAETEIQKITDEFIHKIDGALGKKEGEILGG
ncbi:ribosome recycling factor [Meiothermus granaticius]|uniref:Ribosome-recycling factor n=1 Tax=Meiothermus granaticius NBRC 107808 TaxID=1227551 RepID=A0A399FDI3_9DEIN|nr:ribosome recycling factor [Meiothermus granaticius]RIH93072.1 Ribosome-recycling factor [Meiothermus granaticius NBRC 107808]GEM86653.1 ribosome-recycling factor [Meiothermus granaticius NBRC 107808]